jgi:hypothetical protein
MNQLKIINQNNIIQKIQNRGKVIVTKSVFQKIVYGIQVSNNEIYYIVIENIKEIHKSKANNILETKLSEDIGQFNKGKIESSRNNSKKESASKFIEKWFIYLLILVSLVTILLYYNYYKNLNKSKKKKFMEDELNFYSKRKKKE